ncbi:MAG: carboxymuconolactone decarboxylase family protein [Opitutales bacterium]|nr:carboxymuconolactone decarboxylase family protein [Opitutales bacterium]MCH8539718.1 carboxymuconolactone decarboxylase family protein [Opitutales bacterium]
MQSSSWLPTPPEKRYPFWVRRIFRKQQKTFGQILHPARWWGLRPFRYLLFMLFWRNFDRQRSPLEPTLRALVQVLVAQRNGCAFCTDLNALHLLQREGDLQKLEELSHYAEADGLSEREKTALAYAESITATPVAVDQALQARVKGLFSTEEIAELTGLVAFQNMSAKFNTALDLPSQGLCERGGR